MKGDAKLRTASMIAGDEGINLIQYEADQEETMLARLALACANVPDQRQSLFLARRAPLRTAHTRQPRRLAPQ